MADKTLKELEEENINLRLNLYHKHMNDEDYQQEKQSKEEESRLESIEMYKEQDRELHARILENEILEGYK